ncbi:MAG: cyclic nucleotide-binding domain-containing protein [Lysobacterales bacterium]
MVNLSVLRNLVPLAALLPTDRAELAKRARVGSYASGQCPFTRGETARTVPYLLAGEVELFDGREARLVRAGSTQALHPLSQGSLRQATATCRVDSQILLIDREQMDLVLTWSQTGGIEVSEFGSATGSGTGESDDWMTALLQHPAFHRIPAANIAQLFSCMQPRTVAEGKYIIRQDGVGDAYFLITQGRVQVLREAVGDVQAEMLGELGVGSGFGEEALLSGAPRNASVKALTDVQLMRIESRDFDRLLKAPLLREITLEEVGADVQLLDVRLVDEYRAGHLPGAVNMPLARLRELAAGLDCSRPCVVYCDSGRRSASATYLLCERGFDAHLIAGGVDASLFTESN